MKNSIIVGILAGLMFLSWCAINILPVVTDTKKDNQSAVRRVKPERHLQESGPYSKGPVVIPGELWAPVILVTSDDVPKRADVFLYNKHTFHHDSDCEACQRGEQ